MMKGKSSFQRAIPVMDSLRRRRTLLLSALLMMDGFALGGCVTSLMMGNLVQGMMAVYERDWAQWLAVYNLLDHLIPYYLCYGGALLALTFTTACVWFVSRPPARR
jgi:hypothetical protein